MNEKERRESDPPKPANKQGNRPDPPAEYRWKPGQSGNPSGRPSKKPLTAAIEALLPQQVPAEVLRALRLPGIPPSAKVKWADIAARGTLIAAAKGKSEAFREATDRIEGRVPSEHKVETRFQGFVQQLERMSEAELEAFVTAGTLPAWLATDEERPQG